MGHKCGVGLTLLLLAGCNLPVLRTDSNVRVKGEVEAKMTARVKGEVEGRMRTEIPQVVDPGPLYEVVVPPCPLAPEGAPVVKVAIIDVDGVLTNVNHSGPYSMGENPVAAFKEKLDAAAGDPAVKAVVLRVNSPGGGVAATEMMWHELKCFREATGKPVVASLLDLGAGGGYFLATACDSILALSTSTLGGIGVLLNVYFATEGMNRFGVYENFIRAGEKIDMGTPVRNLKADERKLLEAMARGYHQQFKEVVLKTRPRVKPDADFFDGRVMTGPQAQEAGLIDGLGFVTDAVALACKLAGTEGAKVVMYRRHDDPARSVYATTPNRPIHVNVMPLSIPGPDRSKLPLFLYMWQAEPTLLRTSGT